MTLEIVTPPPYETSATVYQPTNQDTVEYSNISTTRPLEPHTLLRTGF